MIKKVIVIILKTNLIIKHFVFIEFNMHAYARRRKNNKKRQYNAWFNSDQRIKKITGNIAYRKYLLN